MYSSYKPLLVNNYFYNNTAPFRPNIGNYVVKIMMVLGNGTLADISSIDNVWSGIQIDTPITFVVINSEGKIDNSENQNAIRILPISNNTNIFLWQYWTKTLWLLLQYGFPWFCLGTLLCSWRSRKITNKILALRLVEWAVSAIRLGHISGQESPTTTAALIKVILKSWLILFNYYLIQV